MDYPNSSNEQAIASNPNLDLYNYLKKDLKTGDLLQWKHNNLFFGIYRKLIGSEVDHSSLIIRLKQYEGDGDQSNIYIMEATLRKGTALTRLSRKLCGFGGEVWLYRLKSDWTSAERTTIGEELLYYVGIPYDLKAVVKTFFFDVLQRIFKNIHQRWTIDEHELFCSEYCYLAYKKARKNLSDKGPEFVFEGPPHPKDINKLGIFSKRENLYPSPVNDP